MWQLSAYKRIAPGRGNSDEQAARLAADEREPFRGTADASEGEFKPFAAGCAESIGASVQPPGAECPWAMDITYIPTKDGWISLVAILDLYSRMVVSFETSTRLTADFCRQALRHAMAIRNPPRGLIVHSDRGAHFASEAFSSVIDERQALLSMSLKGECHDNAVVEIFRRSPKAEIIEKTALESQARARTTVKMYMDVFDNPRRMHSHLERLPLMAFERRARLSGEIG